jgi:hypothetical protein
MAGEHGHRGPAGPNAEGAVRDRKGDIKSYLKLRPIYHYKRRRVRAHVLICFLAYFLAKQMELELRAVGEHREVELLLRRWDHLKVNPIWIELGEERRTEWQWTLGEVGQGVQTLS